jgi:RHS repeat-associated protein
LNLEYQYDGSGNIRKRIDGNTSSWTETYSYDEHDRLITAAASALGYGALSFAYDQIDNITSKDGKSYTYSTAHPHAVASAGTDTYGYNANGDMTGWKGRTIGYDDAGRMISLSGPNGETYSYDGGSQRRIKTQGTKTTYYFFPEYQEEYTDGALSNTIKYYSANGQLVAQRSSLEGLTYIHSDHLGSTVRMTNPSGGTVLQVLYKPYGAEAIASGGATAKYRFTGQEKEDTGLYYYNARYYDPDLGRFIQADSVLDGLNRYAYCHNDPVRYTDATGNRPFDEESNGQPVPEFGYRGPGTSSESHNMAAKRGNLRNLGDEKPEQKPYASSPLYDPGNKWLNRWDYRQSFIESSLRYSEKLRRVICINGSVTLTPKVAVDSNGEIARNNKGDPKIEEFRSANSIPFTGTADIDVKTKLQSGDENRTSIQATIGIPGTTGVEVPIGNGETFVSASASVHIYVPSSGTYFHHDLYIEY